MPEYLHPTRGSTLRRLLDFKASQGCKFTEDEAVHDVMLAIDRGQDRTLQQWANRWGWGKTTVYRKLEELTQIAQYQRDFRDPTGRKLGQVADDACAEHVEHRGTKVERRGTAVERSRNGKRHSEPSEADSGTAVERSWNEGGTARNEPGTGSPYSPRARQIHTTEVKEKDISKDISKKKVRKWTKSDVEDLYQLYPRKVGKRAALTAIEKALRRISDSPECPDDVVGYLAGRIKTFASSPAGNRGTFTPHPATWFNQGRYLDDEKEWQIEGREGADALMTYEEARSEWQKRGAPGQFPGGQYERVDVENRDKPMWRRSA